MWFFTENRWFTFASQNLASTQVYLKSQQETSPLHALVYKKDDKEDCIQTLFGQKLYCKPYDFEDDNGTTIETETHPGRCILDENIFESYYRQRGDIPLDKIFALYHSTINVTTYTTAQTSHPSSANCNNSNVNDDNKNTPLRNSIEPTRDLIGYGIHLIQQHQTQNQSSLSHSGLEADNALIECLQYYATIPDWVNPQQIVRGQEILTTYLPAIGATLYYRSLVPGFSIPKIAAVLLSTGYLAPPASQQQVQNRLLDTGAFIAAISALAERTHATVSSATKSSVNVPLLKPYSEIWTTILRVRVLHAKVRYALLQRNGSKQWNTKQNGVPINQEDLAATLLAFSYNTLLGIEFILGCPLSNADQLDYLHFWRYVGWLLGVETINDSKYLTTFTNGKLSMVLKYPPIDPCGPGWISNRPNPLEHSYAMFASILIHLSKPDTTSVTVAHHLLQLGGRSSNPNVALENLQKLSNVESNKSKVPTENTMWFYFRSYQCRRYVGHELANALLLPLHPMWHKRWLLHFYSTAYLLSLRLYTWASVPRSPFRSIIFKWHQKNLTSFFKNWSSKFTKRESKTSSTSSTFSNDSTSTNDGVGGDTSEDTLEEQGSSCPFAMVAPPQY